MVKDRNRGIRNSPIHIFRLLRHAAVPELRKTLQVVFQPQSSGFIAFGADFGGGGGEGLRAVDHGQYGITDEIGRMRHSYQSLLIVCTRKIDLLDFPKTSVICVLMRAERRGR